MSKNNTPTGCLRRIIQFPITRIVLALVMVILSVLVAQLIVALLPFDGEADWAGRISITPTTATPLPFGLVLHAVLSAGVTVVASYGAFYAYARFVERRDLIELAPAGVKELGGGALVGALLSGATVCVLAVLGVYEVSGTNDLIMLIIPLASAAISAFLEEVMFRGIIFKIVEEVVGTWLALLISAVMFGLLHLGNPDATLIGSMAIVVEAGVLLAAAYMFTRRLWLAIGIHFAWNFAQAGVFGVTETPGVLQAILTGPTWLSGGESGIDASLVALVLCTAAGIYFIVGAIRRKHVIRPFQRHAPRAR
jgi:membrane protease YdiL (CAAX protease family)